MYYVLLVIFGALGATSRYILSFIIDAGQFPGATLIINLLGCFLLAFVTRFLSQLPYLSARLVSAIGTGFVGSLLPLFRHFLWNLQNYFKTVNMAMLVVTF